MTRGGKDEKSGKSGGREQRLAAALRENLRRRKAQARGRRKEPTSSSARPRESGNPGAKGS